MGKYCNLLYEMQQEKGWQNTSRGINEARSSPRKANLGASREINYRFQGSSS